MLIIGTSKELQYEKSIPNTLQSDIIKVISILDENYGIKRQVISDLGGFVAIIENADDCNEMLNTWKLNVFDDICEETLIIGDYIKKLFIISSDYAVCAYINQNLMKGRR